eukprot:7617136-Pyramimonas_sp.AAC.1
MVRAIIGTPRRRTNVTLRTHSAPSADSHSNPVADSVHPDDSSDHDASSTPPLHQNRPAHKKITVTRARPTSRRQTKTSCGRTSSAGAHVGLRSS